MKDLAEVTAGCSRVQELHWDDDELEDPSWEDVAQKLEALAAGAHELVTLDLDGWSPGERPPTLFAVKRGDGLEIFFRSADHSLHAGQESHTLPGALRIFKQFHEELALDPADGWDHD